MADSVPKPEIEQQLGRMLRSPRFRRAEARARLLAFLVEQALQDRQPSEWDIATQVYGRPESWLSDRDRIIGLYLKRLKTDLAKYYADEGKHDPVVLSLALRSVFAHYRPPDPVVTATAAAFPAEPLLAALIAFYTTPDDPVLRCVVTGTSEELVWHPLDGDPYNPSFANLIPLSEHLHSHIEDLRDHGKKTNLPALDPKRLGDKLAAKHFSEWKVANAYGCTALAFHMGEPPFGEEPSNQRILRICEMLYYARHHFFDPLVHQVVRQIVLPFLSRIETIDPVAAIRLAIQLTALLEEGGYYEEAENALALAARVGRRIGKMALGRGTIPAFTLLRRQAQLLAERAPLDPRFETLFQKAIEQTAHSPDRLLTLQVVRVHRWLRQGTPEALKRAYEVLGPLIEIQRSSLFAGDRFVLPIGLAAADPSEIFLLAGISAARVRPQDWKDSAEENVASAKLLMHTGAHVLPAEYGKFLAEASDRNNAKATRMLRLARTQVRSPLRNDTRANMAAILRCLARARLLDARNVTA